MSLTTPAAHAPADADWPLQIPESRRRVLRLWLWSIAAMTFVVLVVGGITRLTQSGLSIVDWKPFMGVIPPLGEAQWQARFDLYRQFPEYQQLRRGMTLSEFKFIFFWEYLHRLVARAIGLVFLVPFVVFWLRGYLTRPLARRALTLFGLGALQGLMGWLMVQSGLVDRPSVSHYRLAAHLSLAFVIFGYAVWLARDLRHTAMGPPIEATTQRLLNRGLLLIGSLLAVQIVWGAFVAGLKAGHYYPTFPLMGGRLVPTDMFWLEPALRNFVENPIAVQWTHRVIGTILGLAAVAFFVRVQRTGVDTVSGRLNVIFLSSILAQYLLGVLTLVYRVPVSLAVIHQGAAMLVFGIWLWWLHHVRHLRPAIDQSAARSQPTRAGA
jgi:heme a synthase